MDTNVFNELVTDLSTDNFSYIFTYKPFYYPYTLDNSYIDKIYSKENGYIFISYEDRVIISEIISKLKNILLLDVFKFNSKPDQLYISVPNIVNIEYHLEELKYLASYNFTYNFIFNNSAVSLSRNTDKDEVLEFNKKIHNKLVENNRYDILLLLELNSNWKQE